MDDCQASMILTPWKNLKTNLRMIGIRTIPPASYLAMSAMV